MRSFLLPMPPLKDWIKFDTCGEQRVTLIMMILLYHLLAWAFGINQSMNFYTALLYCDAKVEFIIPLINNESNTSLSYNYYSPLFSLSFVSFILLLLIVSGTVGAKT